MESSAVDKLGARTQLPPVVSLLFWRVDRDSCKNQAHLAEVFANPSFGLKPTGIPWFFASCLNNKARKVGKLKGCKATKTSQARGV